MTTTYDALMDITERPPVTMMQGRGSWLTDHTGKRYLDFVQGWAVNCLGHSPPIIARALARKHGLGEVRGRGLLLALGRGSDMGNAVVARAMEQGLLLNAPRPDTLRFMPALNVSEEEVDEMCALLDCVLQASAGSLR